MRAIIRKTECEIEGTAGYNLLNRFHDAAIHDGLNYIFADIDPTATDFILLTNLFVEDMTTDEKVSVIARLLFAEDRTKPIHIEKGDCKALYAHPAWRLWCGAYEDKDTLEADHESVFNVGVDRRKSLETLIKLAKDNIRNALT